MPADSQPSDSKPLLRLLSPGTAQVADSALPHVLLVVDGFPRSLGGGERVVLRLAALLPAYGFRVSILTFSLDPRSSFQPEASPCPLYLLPLTKTYNFEALRGALALRRLIHREHIRIVQTFFESSDLWAGLVTRLLTPAKLIWSRRDMGILRGSKHAAAYRFLRRLPHAVHAVSEQVRSHAIHVDRISPERALTIHNGLDLDNFELGNSNPPEFNPNGAVAESSDTAEKNLVVLTIGNIRHVKGHDILVRAASLVHAKLPKVTFLIAGDVLETGYFQELQDLVISLGLQSTVSFLGGISDLPAHLKAADVFVLPSRSEGFSNSLVEAMACGLPVVATEVGGNAEAVEQNTTGIVVPPENHEALAAALLDLLISSEKRELMGSLGQKRAKSMFSAQAMMQKVTTSYRDVLTSGQVTLRGYQR